MFQPSNIASPEMIHKLCVDVQYFLENGYNADNPAECVTRGQIAEQYMATTGKMLADAKYHVDSIINSKFLQAVKEANESRMQTSTLNKYLDSLTAEYNYLVNWLDRLNRACVHSLEFQRTIISKLKAEAALAGRI